MNYLDEINTAIAGLNIYNIYGKCYGGAPTEPETDERLVDNEGYLLESRRLEEQAPKKKGFTAMDYTPWYFRKLYGKNFKEAVKDNGLPPCTFGIPLMDWANNATVRKQLHIPDYVQDWTMCFDEIDYSENPVGSEFVWREYKNQFRMLKYSGDMDGCVPTIGTLNWINALGREVKEDWRPWYTGDQVAGYFQAFDGLDFVSVHGAGHMVPQDQRERAHYMVNTWLANQSLNRTKYPDDRGYSADNY